jgi:hypothetical protein
MLLGFASAVNHDDRHLRTDCRIAKPQAGNIESHARFCKLFAARQTISLAGSVMRVCSISMTADMSRNNADTQAGSNNEPLCART